MYKKKTLVYFSDCPFFAGCENMIPNFLNSKDLNKSYRIYFFYRKSSKYKIELFKRLDNLNIECIPLELPNQNNYKSLLKSINKIRVLYLLIGSVILFFMKYFTIIYSIIILYREFRNLDIDILHINNGGYPGSVTAYSAVITARMCNVKKIVYVVNNIVQSYTHPLRWFDKPLDFYLKKNISYYITGSKYASNRLIETLQVSKNQVINIPNGVEIRNIKKNKLQLFKYLDLKIGKRFIFSVIALLEKRKGHIWLLKAIKLLQKKKILKDYLFIIEGTGDEYNNLSNFIKKNNLGNYVKLIGGLNNIFDLINASDVIILPSIENEDFPNIIIEAMSLGKPTIGSKIAGIPEQIDHNKNGYLINPKDDKDLLKKIIKISDKKKLKSFSNNAFNKYVLNYKVQISVKKYIKVYNKL